MRNDFVNPWEEPPPADSSTGRHGRPVLTVTALTRRVAQRLAEDPDLHDLGVRGEISNFVHHTSGHMYFSLKDAGSQVRAVMFRRRNAGLKFQPANGMEVVAWGYVGVYEPRGEYQLYVNRLEPGGVGALYQAFAELKERLAEEGLFAPERKRPLPASPRRVALVTSRTGAAVRDLVQVSRRRAPGVQLVLVPTLVQGAAAAPSIVNALRLANRAGDFDVLIVGRGGGSLEDLWAFNEETVARAAAGSKIPVVSAVGHETDFTILDFVADVRAPTPSAAAELVMPDTQQRYRQWKQVHRRLVRALDAHLERRRTALGALQQRTPLVEPLRLLDPRRQRVDDLHDRVLRSMANAVQSTGQRVAAARGRLEALNPYAVLERGYSVFRDPATGRVLSHVADATPGEPAEVIVLDGRVGCRIETKTPGPPEPAT